MHQCIVPKRKRHVGVHNHRQASKLNEEEIFCEVRVVQAVLGAILDVHPRGHPLQRGGVREALLQGLVADRVPSARQTPEGGDHRILGRSPRQLLQEEGREAVEVERPRCLSCELDVLLVELVVGDDQPDGLRAVRELLRRQRSALVLVQQVEHFPDLLGLLRAHLDIRLGGSCRGLRLVEARPDHVAQLFEVDLERLHGLADHGVREDARLLLRIRGGLCGLQLLLTIRLELLLEALEGLHQLRGVAVARLLERGGSSRGVVQEALQLRRRPGEVLACLLLCLLVL
eukprot:scaffold1373_cov367-Pinguiococcus_pyrenoidosus.AAC.11